MWLYIGLGVSAESIGAICDYLPHPIYCFLLIYLQLNKDTLLNVFVIYRNHLALLKGRYLKECF